MLAGLKIVHDDLQAAISTLEHLVTQSVPDKGALAEARWKLSRASGRRLKFLEERIYPFLLAEVDASKEAKIQELRAENVPLHAASITHVSKWPIGAVVHHWPDYQLASKRMQATMRARIAREIEILYPLLHGQ
jgi:hypothetical protein